MGACSGKSKSSSAANGAGGVAGGTQQQAPRRPPGGYSWEKKAKDPKDFLLSKLSGEKVLRQEGSIAGEMFLIEECKDCDIFLCDHMATIHVDMCDNCRIFVGPTESSLFVRNCKKCDFVAACQQLRTRDCEDCRFALFCTTEPVIETSVRMAFACFDFFYFSLRQHFTSAGLKIWNNKWWQVYDFNKNAAAPNWGLFPQEEVAVMLKASLCSEQLAEEAAMGSRAVPVTLGSRPLPFPQTCMVLFLPDPAAESYIETFLEKAEARRDTWSVVRTRAIYMNDVRAKQLFDFLGSKEGPKVAKAVLKSGEPVTAVEVCGAEIHSQVTTLISTTGLAAGSSAIKPVPANPQGNELGRLFFEVWKDEI